MAEGLLPPSALLCAFQATSLRLPIPQLYTNNCFRTSSFLRDGTVFASQRRRGGGTRVATIVLSGGQSHGTSGNSMSAKQILSVGQRGADHGSLSHTLRSQFGAVP